MFPSSCIPDSSSALLVANGGLGPFGLPGRQTGFDAPLACEYFSSLPSKEGDLLHTFGWTSRSVPVRTRQSAIPGV
jgi:hypothetical protein